MRMAMAFGSFSVLKYVITGSLPEQTTGCSRAQPDCDNLIRELLLKAQKTTECPVLFVVSKKFESGRKYAKTAVNADRALGAQVDGTARSPRCFDRADDQVQKRIKESLTKGGFSPKTVIPASSKPFWDNTL